MANVLSTAGNTICTIGRGALEALKKTVQVVAEGTKKVVSIAVPVIKNVAVKTGQVVSHGAKVVGKATVNVLNNTKNAICTVSKKSLPYLKEVGLKSGQAIAKGFNATKNASINAFYNAKNFVTNSVVPKLNSASNRIGTVSKNVFINMKNKLSTGINQVKGKAVDNYTKIKNAHIGSKIKTSLTTAKNKITSVNKERLEKLKDVSKRTLRVLKAKVKNKFNNMTERFDNNLEIYSDYLDEIEAYKEEVEEQRLEQIENNLEEYRNIKPDNLVPETPIFADINNSKYRQLTGKNNENFIVTQPKVMDFIIDNHDYLISNGFVRESFFELFDFYKLKMDILSSSFSEEIKDKLCLAIDNEINNALKASLSRMM